MTATTPKGITYMQAADTLALVASVMQQLATDVDNRLPTYNVSNVSGTSHAAGALITVSFNHGLGFTPTKAMAEIAGFVTNSAAIVCKGVTAISATQLTVTLLNTSAAALTYTNLPIRWVAAQF